MVNLLLEILLHPEMPPEGREEFLGVLTPRLRSIGQWRELLRDRTCPVCGRHVPEGEGVYYASLHAVFHRGGCDQTVAALAKTHRKTTKGRWRSWAEWRRLIDIVAFHAPG